MLIGFRGVVERFIREGVLLFVVLVIFVVVVVFFFFLRGVGGIVVLVGVGGVGEVDVGLVLGLVLVGVVMVSESIAESIGVGGLLRYIFTSIQASFSCLPNRGCHEVRDLVLDLRGDDFPK